MPSKAGLALLALYTRQLAAMVRSGIPIHQALESLSGGEHQGLNQAFREVSLRVQSGSYLSAALARHEHYFPGYFTGLVRVGEQSGSLALVLERLAEHLERSSRLQQRLLAAITYPLVLVSASVALLLFLITSVLPLMRPLFEQAHSQLPWLTRLCLGLADRLRSPETWAVLLAGAGLAAALVHRLRGAEAHSPLRRARDRALLRLPVLGPLLRWSTVSQLFRLFSLMVAAGVEIRSVLLTLANTVTWTEFQEALVEAEEVLRSGQPLSQALAAADVFPGTCVQMVEVAEESGQLERLLGVAADLYEAMAEGLVQTLMDLLEPVLVCVASLLVGTVCIAVLQPWLQLLSSLL